MRDMGFTKDQLYGFLNYIKGETYSLKGWGWEYS